MIKESIAFSKSAFIYFCAVINVEASIKRRTDLL